MPKARARSGLALGLALALVVLFGVLAASGWAESKTHLASIGWRQAGLLLALSTLNYGARGLRWHLYTRALGLSTSLGQDFRHYLGGFALTLTPARVGELVRLRWLARDTKAPLAKIAPLVLVDRAADLVSVAIVLALAAALSAAGVAGAMPVALGAIGVALFATHPRLLAWGITRVYKMLGRFPRLFAGLRRAARQLHSFRAPAVILPALVLGGIGWFAESYAFYLLLGWLGADIGMWAAVAIFLFAMLGGGATGLPGGLGGAEAALLGLLSLQGVPLAIGVPATAIIRLTTLWFAILIGIIVFPFAERKGQKNALEKR